MNPNNEDRLLALLGEIAVSLDQIARNTMRAQPEEPNYQRPIDAYARFDWSSIDASVVATDGYGPTLVEWGGFTWKRRSPENKFGTAIWFSRSAGKDDDGANKYLRLITFKPMGEIEPLSRGAEQALRAAPPQPKPAVAAVKPVVATTPPTAAEMDREFEDMPSAAEERAGAQPPLAAWQTNLTQSCPNCGELFLMENETCPRHRAPRQPGEALTRQATLAGGGRVNAEFSLWARGFAQDYPHYILKTGEADMYHILKTLSSLGIETVAAGNLAYVQARLINHAAQQPTIAAGK